MSKDLQINPMELIGEIGTTNSALKDVFENEQIGNRERASRRLVSCESNQQTYRSMLQSDDYSFEEKAQIHDWIVDEDERMKKIDAEHFTASREILSGIVVAGAIMIGLALSACNSEAAQKCLKAAGKTLPRLIAKSAAA